MSKEQRQSSNLLKPRSFDVYKNAIEPIIAMLGCLEIDTEVLDTSMEAVKSNECKEMSGDDEDVNGVLAVIQEEARFFYKDRQKFIDLFT